MQRLVDEQVIDASFSVTDLTLDNLIVWQVLDVTWVDC